MTRLFALAASVCLSLFAGCAPGTPTTGGTPATTATTTSGGATTDATAKGPSTGPLRIAMIPKGTTHEFWKSVHAGANLAAQELGNVELYWKGPILENDREDQIAVVQGFIVQKVDGICLAPLDSSALVAYVEEAVENKIPVVVFDSGLDKTDSIVSYVASDNRKGGELAAHRMAEVLGGSGQVIVLRYNPGSDSTYQREEGFLATLKSEYPGIEVVSSDQYAGTTPESALATATQVLQKFQDTADGIFAVCEPNATGVLRAIKELELTEKVKFIAFDPAPELIEGLTSGTVHGIVLQDPVTMGYESVMTIVKHIRGEKMDTRVGTGEYVATPENMSEENMQKLLEPEQFGAAPPAGG